MSASVTINLVRRSLYLDSVALMRMAAQLLALSEVDDASLMIGTDANKTIMNDAGLLDVDGKEAGPNDLIVAIRASSKAAATAALEQALSLLDHPGAVNEDKSDWRPRSLAGALQVLPEANFALISIPGEFAAREARNALARGLNVMVFSDNVSVEDEVRLKRLATEKGLLMMGPDCGTAILGGVPIAFANVVPRGPIGAIAASGTGLQEFSSLIARAGGGLSHAIGVGGRDLSDAVGGSMTFMALAALEEDSSTERIVLISKPPGPKTAQKLFERLAVSPKPIIACLIGLTNERVPSSVIGTNSIRGAAEAALGVSNLFGDFPLDALASKAASSLASDRRWLRALFAGGTLCAEAQALMQLNHQPFRSNVPIPNAEGLADGSAARHTLIDLGADEYTAGRPHPMIEPSVRSQHLRRSLADPEVAIVLLDVVLGYGAHPDPAGEVAQVCDASAGGPVVVASVCGTQGDPQGYADQVRKLEAAHVIVAPSNAQAAALAIGILEERA